jgi:hypothetical protein
MFCVPWNFKDEELDHSQTISLKHLTYLPSTQLIPLKIKRYIKRNSPRVFHKTELPTETQAPYQFTILNL